jgi:hypothetical protein
MQEQVDEDNNVHALEEEQKSPTVPAPAVSSGETSSK